MVSALPEQLELSLKRSELILFFVASVLAVLFHFLYDASGKNGLVALISPINESVWEHTKIIFYPYLFLSVIQYFFLVSGSDRVIDPASFIVSKIIGAISLIPMLIIFYYTYTGIFGRGYLLVDILSTFLFLGLAYLISYRLIQSGFTVTKPILILAVTALVITILFIVYATINPPDIPLFISSEG